jgi:hypothetical protein
MAVLLAGCGGTAPASTAAPTTAPTVAPTVAPTPTPSPTPAPAELATAAFAGRDLRARVLLEGTADFGGNALTSSGTMDVIGDAEHESYTTKVGDQVIEARDVISIGSDEWKRVDEGPWHDSDGTDDSALVDDLAKLTALEVVGPETVEGESLIHVRPGPGVTLEQADWGPRDPSVTDYTIDLDLWIRPDGTLVRLIQDEAWTMPSGATTISVTATATETFTPLPASVTIEAPADAWVAHTSSAQGYTISQPAGYEVDSGDGGDAYVSGEEILLTVVTSQLQTELSLDDTILALAESYKQQADAELLMALDTRIDGKAAKIAVFRLKDSDGTELGLADAVVVIGTTVWEVYRVGLLDTVDADVDYLGQSLTTFDFDD